MEAIPFASDAMLSGAALLLAALVIADFFVPMLPSATLIATLAGFLIGEPLLLVGLFALAAASSWLGDALGLSAMRRARTGIGRALPAMRGVAGAEARLRRTLERHPVGTTLIARFLPAGRTALAWAAVSAPDYRHGRMAALAAAVWASYMVGLGLFIAWLLGPGLYSAATTITSVSAAGMVIGWWFTGGSRTAPGLRRTADAPAPKPAVEPRPVRACASILET